MKRVAFLYLVPEGVNTWVAGVGSVINANMLSLPGVVRRMREEYDVELSVFFGTPAATPKVRGWNPKQLELAEKLAAETGGRVFLLPNQTDGSENFGNLDSWKVISGAGAAIAIDLGRQYDKVVTLAHSSHPFALTPIYIDMQAEAAGIDATSVFTIHSTAIQDRTYNFKGEKFPDPERIMVEAMAVQWAKFTHRIKLGCISHYMGEHLVKSHGADPSTLCPTMNGIDLSNPIFELLPEAKKEAKLKEAGIPTDKPLFFSWGRFVHEKGFDICLDLVNRLGGALHPVIVGMTDHSPEYPQQMIDYAKEHRIEASIIVKRDWDLVMSLAQWKHTKLVGILSRYDEPHGLTVNEARYHARNGGPVVMVSNRGGLPEQIDHGVDGLIANLDDLDETTAMLKDFLTWSEEKCAQVRANAVETLKTKFSFENNIIDTLKVAIPLK